MQPPEGSRFNVENKREGIVLSWYDYKAGMSDLGGGCFLLFWLGGWAVGECFAIRALLDESPISAKAFLIFWLGGWTIGGLAAMSAVIDIFRLSKPTKLVFMPRGSLKFVQGSYRKRTIDREGDESMSVVKKGKKYGIFHRSDIHNLKLERIGALQRLTFDYKSQRIEIGKGLEEPEREWLLTELESFIG